MALVKIRVPRTSQPQDACGIDWSNPIVKLKKLKFAWTGSVLVEVVTQALPTSVGAVTGAGPAGKVAVCSAGQKGVEWSKQFLTTSTGDGLGDFTLIASVTAAAASAVGHLFAQKNDAGGSPYAQCALLVNSSDTASAFSGGAAFYTFNSPSASGVYAASQIDGGRHIFAGVRSGTLMSLYRDGVLQASSTQTVRVITQTSPSRYTAIGSRGNGTTESLVGSSDFAFGFDDSLSASEIKSITDNPYQIFEPEERWIWVPDAAGGGLALDANVSAITSTSAALSSAIAIASSTGAAPSTTSLLSSTVALASVANATPTGSAQVSTAIALVASSSALTTSASALTTSIRVASGASAVPTSGANLTAVGQGLSANASATPTSTAALSTSVRMAAIGNATPSSAASLTAIGQGLSAIGNAAPSGSAQASTVISLGAVASAAASETATLLTTIRLSSSVAASTGSAASLSAGGIPWAASNAARTVAAAALTTQILAAASASARTASAATLTGGKPGTPGELILTELKIATITVSALKFATIDAEVLNNG